jgi:Leucine-rich repeat (LRR) protein
MTNYLMPISLSSDLYPSHTTSAQWVQSRIDYAQECCGDIYNFLKALQAYLTYRPSKTIGDISCLYLYVDDINTSEKIGRIDPDTLSEMIGVRIMAMRSHNLTEISPEIGMCTSLEYLALDNNKLTTLPEEMRLLSRLRTLSLLGNNFSPSEKSRISDMVPAGCCIYFDNSYTPYSL